MNVNELDTKMDSLRAQMRVASDKLATMVDDQTVTMESLREQKATVADLNERISMLEEQKAQMAARVQTQPAAAPAVKMSAAEARGQYLQAALQGDLSKVSKMAYEQLGSIPANNADQGNGSKVLPTQLANELLLEPKVTNPLRQHMTVTQITGLELPKLGFTVADDAYAVKDGETAKELAANAENISFGRHKMHLIAKVSESLLRATPLNVEAAVMEGLENAQANRELKALFATAPAAGEEEMSFYSAKNAIKAVEGEDMLDAIIAAHADLEDAYRANAKVVMSYATYAAMIRTLAGHDNLFGKKPEDIIGIPVVFCDAATTPIVGDFKFVHMNFDSTPWFDTDKDLTTGNRLFDCTALYDIKLRMRAAFRLAKVAQG